MSFATPFPQGYTYLIDYKLITFIIRGRDMSRSYKDKHNVLITN